MDDSLGLGVDDSLSGSGLHDGESNDLLFKALGMPKSSPTKSGAGEEEMTEPLYDIVPDPNAEIVDLSDLRGVGSSETKKAEMDMFNSSDMELENLAELVPDLKARRRPTDEDEDELERENAAKVLSDGQDFEVVNSDGPPADHKARLHQKNRKLSMKSGISLKSSKSTEGRRLSNLSNTNDVLKHNDSMLVQTNGDVSTMKKMDLGGGGYSQHLRAFPASHAEDSTNDDGYPDSEHALEDDRHHNEDSKIPSEFMNLGSSAQSVSTATQTHEVRMPMYLPTFKPATGCTNASDFIVRCFVARLRSGITVVKHGRSRWCKSRLRILHIHPDGRSLSWKPAEGEPASSKRPPKLDLSTCLEVRHAWSPDPQNPMYTGTPILRQKCEAANAHKSFALIFKQRTVDITAVTADQCKVLMEGFSALCFRLQVANLAGRGGAKKGQHARPMPEEDGVSTTASATLTNTSTPRVR